MKRVFLIMGFAFIMCSAFQCSEEQAELIRGRYKEVTEQWEGVPLQVGPRDNRDSGH